jgi:hypothetical protein
MAAQEVLYSLSAQPVEGLTVKTSNRTNADNNHERTARGGHGLPKVLPGSAMPYLSAGHPLNGLMAVSVVARPQGEQPAAIFYPFGHPTRYTYDNNRA